MKKYEILEEDFDRFMKDCSLIGHGSESIIYKRNDEVFKILNYRNINLRTKARLEKIAESGLDKYLTVPTSEIYVDYKFYGYGMDYAGVNLKKYLHKKKVSRDEIIEILHKVKECLINLHDANFVHGDLKLSNILVNDGEVKITDVNNMKLGILSPVYLNMLSSYLMPYYGHGKALDIHAFNYITFCLLNYTGNYKYDLLRFDTDSFFMHMSDDISEETIQPIVNPDKKLKKVDVPFLIDKY